VLTFLTALALAAPAPSGSCVQGETCLQANAAQLFALADQLYREGDLRSAAAVLVSLTQDKHPELRAEARFRLAAIREKMGDLSGAAQALGDLLAEQPGATPARLELARILSRMGDEKAARDQLARAEAAGLPDDVQVTVRKFESALASENKRGLTIEISAGPDSNVNRATSNPFVDTIIAPFELDENARSQSAFGYSFTAQAYSRDRLGGLSLLSNAGIRADMSTKPQFNDIQAALDSGPEFGTDKISLRPSLRIERRWYGGDLYSSGLGGALEVSGRLGPRTQLALSSVHVRQNIANNNVQDGWRTSLGADLSQMLGPQTSARISLRYASLNARVNAESLRQPGAGLLVIHGSTVLTIFGEADYNYTRGIEPIFLFGKTRRDHRWDLTGGAIFNSLFRGFAPLARLTYTDSRSNIELYDYRRVRLDVGVTRSF
jgi:hypothetical protein